MKKFFLVLSLIVFFSSCALLPKKTSIVKWPEKIDYIEALCELDMSWKDMRYSGSMSLIMDYPHRLFLEVYSPMGDTVFFLNRDRDYFLLLTGEERILQQKRFEEKFGININEFIDDLAMRGCKKEFSDKIYTQRERYKVFYQLDPDTNTICWEGIEGKICIKFLEAIFNREGKKKFGKDSS